MEGGREMDFDEYVTKEGRTDDVHAPCVDADRTDSNAR